MRLDAGVSYETFAEWIGVSGHTVYRVLTRKRAPLYATTAHKFRRFLEMRGNKPARRQRSAVADQRVSS